VHTHIWRLVETGLRVTLHVLSHVAGAPLVPTF